jgi:Tfp pilus assembly pilus retraction ATPase PilT
MEQVALTTSLGKLLDWCVKQQATDLHAQANRRFAYRVDGKLLRIPPERFPPPTNEEIMTVLQQAFSSSIFERIEKQH